MKRNLIIAILLITLVAVLWIGEMYGRECLKFCLDRGYDQLNYFSPFNIVCQKTIPIAIKDYGTNITIINSFYNLNGEWVLYNEFQDWKVA